MLLYHRAWGHSLEKKNSRWGSSPSSSNLWSISNRETIIIMCKIFLQEFINFTLHYIADLDIPIKRLVNFKYLPLERSSINTNNRSFLNHFACLGEPLLSSEVGCSMYRQLGEIAVRKNALSSKSMTRYTFSSKPCICTIAPALSNMDHFFN